MFRNIKLQANDFKHRRRKLIESLEQNSIVLLPAAPVVYRNADNPYPYRQNSDFYYLTQFEEPDAVMVLTREKFILFCHPHDPDEEEFMGQDNAVKLFGADEAYDIAELARLLPQLISPYQHVYHASGTHSEFDRMVSSLMSDNAQNVLPYLHNMRLIKDEKEVVCIRHAINVTEKAFVRAMTFCKPGQFEYELNAEFMHELHRHGIEATSYRTVMGSGSKTCRLHNHNIKNKIPDGSLVLIDMGAEYNYYAADITRTFPANGKYSPEQRAIYEIVLAAQVAVINAIKPGATWPELHKIAAEIMTTGLVKLGLLHGSVKKLMKEEAYTAFFTHNLGHWMGLDVHDVGVDEYSGVPLAPGMVIAIEPGIYISKHIPDVPVKWQNIGIRIEDNILITAAGCEVLSRNIPKTIQDIEITMAKRRENKEEKSSTSTFAPTLFQTTSMPYARNS